MNWMAVARIAKVLALLAFLAPWMAVSCNGTPLVEATGLGLIIGDAQPSADSPLAGFTNTAETTAPEGAETETATNEGETLGSAQIWVSAGFGLIVLALVLGLVVRPERRGAGAALAAGVLALAALGGGMGWTVNRFQAEKREALAEAPAEADPNDPFAGLGQGMASAMASAVTLDIEWGYWLTVALLAVGVGAAGMAANGRSLPTITVNVSREGG